MNRKPLFGIGVDTILIYINTKHVRGPSGLGYINFGGWGLVFCNFKGHGDWLWKNWSRGLDPSEKRIEMQFAIPFIFKFFFADVIKIFWWKVWGRRVGRFHDRNAIHHTFHFQILFRWYHQNLLVELCCDTICPKIQKIFVLHSPSSCKKMKKAFILVRNNKPKWLPRFSCNFHKNHQKIQGSFCIGFSMQNEWKFMKISKNNKKYWKTIHFPLENQWKMEGTKNVI